MTRSWWLSLATAGILLSPVTVQAAAIIVQDSCWAVGPELHLVSFSVRNDDIDDGICALQLIPAPQPPRPECTISEAGVPGNWAGGLNGFGGAWYGVPPFDRRECVGAGGGLKSGFYFAFPGGHCCYTAQYYDFMFSLVLEQEECFTCGAVSIEHQSWGLIKSHYRD